VEPIQSKGNARLKEVRALRAGKDKEACLLEGPRLLGEALESGVQVRWVLHDSEEEGFIPLLAKAEQAGAEILPCARKLLREGSDLDSPRGILAVAERSSASLEEVLDTGGLVVVSAGIQDPGNLGSILRSAAGLGASGLVVLQGGSSPWHSRAIRGSAGMVFRLPVTEGVSPEAFFSEADGKGYEIVATGNAGEPPGSFAPFGSLALLLGEEGGGLDPHIAQRCSRTLTIPLGKGVESLNVGAAAAVMIHALVGDPSASG
jgi:TrmH family RNA methyltransferase